MHLYLVKIKLYEITFVFVRWVICRRAARQLSHPRIFPLPLMSFAWRVYKLWSAACNTIHAPMSHIFIPSPWYNSIAIFSKHAAYEVQPKASNNISIAQEFIACNVFLSRILITIRNSRPWPWHCYDVTGISVFAVHAADIILAWVLSSLICMTTYLTWSRSTLAKHTCLQSFG